MKDFENKTEEEWKKFLTPEKYSILREKGTEPAFSGEYHDNKEEGMYVCGGCGAKLFSSQTKFDSGTGWPSFYEPASEEAIGEESDNSMLVRRTEVICNRCGGHLGHVFSDGPKTLPDGRQATGLRYCINSDALNFNEGKESNMNKE